jgi:DNA-binding MarR family transcriptional regulator
MTENNLSEIANLDRLIHEPARLLIMAILSTVEETDFLYLNRESGLTKGNLSAHLSKLDAAGYIEIEKTYRGKLPMTLLRMAEPGRKAFKAYQKQMRRVISR